VLEGVEGDRVRDGGVRWSMTGCGEWELGAACWRGLVFGYIRRRKVRLTMLGKEGAQTPVSLVVCLCEDTREISPTKQMCGWGL
jgi:hypothetical protein